MYTKRKLYALLYCLFPAMLIGSCKKLVEIGPPVTTITSKEVFAGYTEAEWAISGVYSRLIHGPDNPSSPQSAAEKGFAAGLSTILGGLSSDEILCTPTDNIYLNINNNKITIVSSGATANLWNSAYKTIFDANAVIEGIAGSDSPNLHDSTRKQLTGEALTIRAFAYFYLVNYFGDLPMPLNIDFNKTVRLSRSPVTKVYEQIITDLKKAIPLLQTSNTVEKAERVRISRWFAEALLARVCLFSGDYPGAVASATNVLNQTGRFNLEPDPAHSFLNTSKEIILQLRQTNLSAQLGKATPEGYVMSQSLGAGAKFSIRPALANSFEAGDKRKSAWIAQSGSIFRNRKYKIGNTNQTGPANEYYVVMRLAELYLIRAEASILLSPTNTENAINDLNTLRGRANASLLPLTLSPQEVTDAIARERQLELFAEWGHRWLDLKRTGKATEVLSTISSKLPWDGDHQLLYPIPEKEIRDNSNINQNPGYFNL